MNIRQPIVSVLGHVDHGKTSILDFIRKSSVMSREAGAITQHIGATEVPLEVIHGICGPMVKPGTFRIPGLLFIDTPGHHSFTSLRSRGGALADIAVLVIDIREGFKPQTIESIHILRRLKTPFVVAANKIDILPGWESRRMPFALNLKRQSDEVVAFLDENLYKLVGQLHDHGFPSERYDRIQDYSRSLGIIPVSAKTGEGISDLLMLLIGMAQKFLGKRLEVCGRRVMISESGKRDVEKSVEQLAREDLMTGGGTGSKEECTDETREKESGDEAGTGIRGKYGDPGKAGDGEEEYHEERKGEEKKDHEEEDHDEDGEAGDREVEDGKVEEKEGKNEGVEVIYEDEPAHATVLEVKAVKGLGTTLDTIVYRGTMKYNDTIVVGAKEPLITTIKALLKPKPLDEIRDPRQKFDKVRSVSAAAGIKIAAPGLEDVIAGAPIRVVPRNDPGEIERMLDVIRKESTPNVNVDLEGILIKADAIGSLEALASELEGGMRNNAKGKSLGKKLKGKSRERKLKGKSREKKLKGESKERNVEGESIEKVPVKIARIGDISRRDVIDAATMPDPMHRVILAFNVDILPDAREELESGTVKVIDANIIYKLLDDYGDWAEKRRHEMEEDSRIQLVYPGKVIVLGDHIFHISKPAVFGVRVLAGRIRPGMRFLRRDGIVVGVLRSIRSGDESLKEARAGEEVALAVEGVTMGRQIKGEFILYSNIPESHAQELQKLPLNHDEKEILSEIIQIKRKETKFWGMPR